MPTRTNGYTPSIIPGHDEYTCFLCGQNGGGRLHRHEIFGGATREKSKKGLWVHLCPECHRKVHDTGDGTLLKLRKIGQQRAMEEWGWSEDEFRKIFGKNYI